MCSSVEKKFANVKELAVDNKHCVFFGYQNSDKHDTYRSLYFSTFDQAGINYWYFNLPINYSGYYKCLLSKLSTSKWI
ncbi:hypothetical protein EAF00_001228 [Botryotinia globosa]|nr:hypothetical protein EAF00_001228 [Botryotinia globosa]